ncbi:hypothetical protein SAMN00017405_0868 [Desulfonispora thiosulfatigenes DSM 11270]|uniref:Calcineurin-like phosphoesterase domain-containing protein n=1 Tax=Desulfonispora thiosulfatigenes DSM 11270 TaxID=656914 RepID=A0A1W1UH14_DESTI|nr:metallophosphoesterase [Desulfonispora thiosulfatigenes]SMB80395.1 hypothetical protein SAMN00017405_0868 [Desulfonispora thiosulfatigenes DSM 11270]
MKIFALSDLHLSFDENYQEYKPMNIFGEKWQDHAEKIKENWVKTVSNEDIVLVPGDLSWGLNLEDIVYDLSYLENLPGKKIISKGNHDLWWKSLSKVRKALPENIIALQNDHIILNNQVAICGTRGWLNPEDKNFKQSVDLKIYKRELGRLKLSLKSIKEDIKDIIVMLHYPPTSGKHEFSEFVEIMTNFNVKTCIYGHLHSEAIFSALPEEKWGINFHIVSADAIGFCPKLIYSFKSD